MSLGGMPFEYIDSADLTPDQIPARAANWEGVVAFASTFDTSEAQSTSEITGAADIHEDSSVPEMRLAIYVEWRRWNHFCRDPDHATVQSVQMVLDQLRDATRQADDG